MSIISRITTWATNQVLTSSALNAEFNNVVNLLNNLDSGTTTWDNVNATASSLGVATATSIALNGGTVLGNYQEGTWTPTDGSGAGLSFTVDSATYTRIGRVVFITFFIVYPSTSNGNNAIVAGLPFTVNGANVYGTMANVSLSTSNNLLARFESGSTHITFAKQDGTQLTNANISTLQVIMSGFYII